MKKVQRSSLLATVLHNAIFGILVAVLLRARQCRWSASLSTLRESPNLVFIVPIAASELVTSGPTEL